MAPACIKASLLVWIYIDGLKDLPQSNFYKNYNILFAILFNIIIFAK